MKMYANENIREYEKTAQKNKDDEPEREKQPWADRWRTHTVDKLCTAARQEPRKVTVRFER